MIVTKDNVKVGDTLYIVCTDTRTRPYHMEVEKIGRKYVEGKWGRTKIILGTNEVFHKDGIGATELVFKDEEEYKEYKTLSDTRTTFARNMNSSFNIFNKMSLEDIEIITNIMCKYDSKWRERNNYY